MHNETLAILHLNMALKLSSKRHLPIYVLSLLFLINRIPIYLSSSYFMNQKWLGLRGIRPGDQLMKGLKDQRG